jgi:dihydrofolate synthase / folylpolyglutamate synthase
MTYSEAISYLYTRLPVFHRVGVSAFKPGFANIMALMDVLEWPYMRFESIHVAGTNGKGSTSHLIASVLQAAGYRVGLFTSPHLQSFTERIRINGEPISEEVIASFVEQHQHLIELVAPSFYEVSVAIAFDYFARQNVDVAVIEVGLGGRLDATNIITPLLSVITNIGWDHADILGDTLVKIAAEKGGIIKKHVPVVLGESQAETLPVFREFATQRGCRLVEAEQVWRCENDGITEGVREVRCRYIGEEGAKAVPTEFTVQLPLVGLYQLANLQTVLSALSRLPERYTVNVPAIQQGVASVISQTGLKGRFQFLQSKPLVIADTAHNVPGLQAVLHTVRSIPHNRLHIIIGFVKDKDVESALLIFPTGASYYFCQPDSPRALPVDELVLLARRSEKLGNTYIDVNEARKAALAVANPDDLILITGSTYVVAELTNL